jgi:serine phosphatase RsbU (regulator of sigma subunit)/DNA-binding response OmpR family regulator
MDPPIRLLVVDDHTLFREGVKALLSTTQDIVVVGEAADGVSAVQQFRQLRPQVILMDINMPDSNGIDATLAIVADDPQVGVIMVTMLEDDASVFAAMRAGARGYVLKGANPQEMLGVIRAVAEGQALFGPAIAARIASFFQDIRNAKASPMQVKKLMEGDDDLAELSVREREVLELIATGYNNTEIAHRLDISPKMVRNHITNIFYRLHAQTLELEQKTNELKKAGQVQESLLPENLPKIPGWELAVVLEPAHETSGDFYDFLPLPDGKVGMVIADVTDKGMSAALYMALSRSLWRTFALDHPVNPELTMTETNRHILADTHGGLFVTLLYGILNPHDGTFTYCSAGHHPALLIRAKDSSIEELAHTGIPLGVFDEARWNQECVEIKPGDAMVLYTDGITDAQNPAEECFNLERLRGAIKKHHGKPARELLEALLRQVHNWVGSASQFDDITLMVIVRGKATC